MHGQKVRKLNAFDTVITVISVAGILSGVHFFLKKVDFFSRRLQDGLKLATEAPNLPQIDS